MLAMNLKNIKKMVAQAEYLPASFSVWPSSLQALGKPVLSRGPSHSKAKCLRIGPHLTAT